VYVVLFTAQHSDDGKPHVVYMNEKHGTFYIRPLKEFTSDVNVDSEDGAIPRFKLLEEK
jgi:hypothetical protein